MTRRRPWKDQRAGLQPELWKCPQPRHPYPRGARLRCAGRPRLVTAQGPAAWDMWVRCLQRRTSDRPKRPLGCPSGLNRLKCSRSVKHQAIDRPRRRASGRSAEIRRQCDTGIIHSRRPTLNAPLLSHGCDRRRVSDLLCDTFHNKIEVVRRQAQRTPRVTSDIPSFPGVFTGLEPEGGVDPHRPYTSDVWTAVLIDRRQPTGVSIGPTSARSLAQPLRESVCDAVPVEERKPIEVGKVFGSGRCASGRRTGVDHRSHSALDGNVGASQPSTGMGHTDFTDGYDFQFSPSVAGGRPSTLSRRCLSVTTWRVTYRDTYEPIGRKNSS